MDDPTCPLCRANLTPSECSKVFTSTKVKPMFDRVFTMSGAKQKVAFGIINDIIGHIDNNDTQDELDVFKSFMSSYFTSIRVLTQARDNGMRDQPTDMMYDWVDVLHGATNHIRRFNTYTGFTVESDGTLLSWSSRTPYVPRDPRIAPPAPPPYPPPWVAPQGGMVPPIRVVEPVVIREGQVAGDDGMYYRSPSPTIPWWGH